MKHLAPCLGSTPRRALRFLNVYRVIKASLSAEQLHKLENDGGYRGLMTQLAVTTGSPSLQTGWFEVLTAADRKDMLPEIEARLKAKRGFNESPDSRRLLDTIAAFWSKRQTPGPEEKSGPSEAQAAVDRARIEGVADLKHYADLAVRYSFGA
jgi:hypothetical protein